MRIALTIWLLLAGLSAAAEAPLFPATPPTAPKDVARSFRVLEGFSMQLIAAEPLVNDPVSITYDEDGRAYVCEMCDYPYTDKSRHKPSQENPTDESVGRVRLLEDTDGDGGFDKATVFADGLSWPTGAACWKGGVFVTATPDVWYLKDTDSDGRADVRERVFTGLRKLNVQAVANNPIWGLDNRIYIAGGSNGGSIARPDQPGSAPVEIRRHDVSFDPRTRRLRIESGGARFGNSFNDWGERFLCNIRNPCQHVALPYRFLAHNPFLVVNPLVDCAESGDQLPVFRTSPVEPWREFRARRWSAEGSHLPRSELVGAGVVTSSSGLTIYRGDAYPPEYRDFAFVADVAGNLFYRMRLEPHGTIFRAVQVDGNKNFCTSDDPWFRPVNFTNAPDGCLHVCDMYREVIEHPWSIPDDIHAGLDLLRGRDKGRIYRLAPPNHKPRQTPRLGEASSAELAELLGHPNAWHRETAQRLLVERQDRGVLARLRQLAREGKTPLGRVHALWVLEGLGELGSGVAQDMRAPNRVSDRAKVDPAVWMTEMGITAAGYATVLEAMQDSDPRVRRQAVRLRPEAALAPRSLEEIYHLRPDAKRLLADPDVDVRVETILHHTLVWSPAVLKRFAELAVEHREQPQVLQALLLAAAESSFPMLQEVLKAPELAHSEPLRQFAVDCSGMIGRAFRKGDPDAPYHVLKHLTIRGGADELARRMTLALAEGLRRGSSSLERAAAESFRISGDEAALAWFDELRRGLIADLQDTAAPPSRVADAAALLSELSRAEEAIPMLRPCLAATRPSEVQFAALAALTNYRGDKRVTDCLVSEWKTFSPALRERALTAFLAYPDRITALLDAIEAGEIPVGQITAAPRASLAKSRDKGVVERVEKLFGQGGAVGKQGLLAKYLPALSLAGDRESGARVYETACMVCHRHQERGNDIGPNLATVRGWTPEQILTNVLDPNREVSPNFALYIIELTDGRIVTGMIATESAGNITVKRADGGTEEILRTEIKSLSSPGLSLMPEGLENAITPRQMADLIAYLTDKG